MILDIERGGYFIVHVDAESRNKCGTPDNHVLHYKVKIETTSDNLDHNGFIIDNNEIHDYFVWTYRYASAFESCEKIAMAACEEFRSRVIGCKKVAVSISGNPANAWLTCSWERLTLTNKRNGGYYRR